MERARAALDELDSRCCEPGRSPRMADLARTLDNIDSAIERTVTESADAEAIIAELEAAGAQIGSLQVGCCAPDRLPLYAEILQQLTEVQLAINRSLGRGH